MANGRCAALQRTKDGHGISGPCGEEAARRRDAAEVLGALASFYDIIFDGCGNQFVGSIARSLLARMQYLRATTTIRQSEADTRQSIENFRAIVRAILGRDPAAAGAACLDQVRHAALVAMEILRDEPEAPAG